MRSKAMVAALVIAACSGVVHAEGPSLEWLKSETKATQYANSFRSSAELILNRTGAERSKAVDAMYQLARAGYGDALNFTGFMLDNGIGVQQDSRTAARYFNEAMKRGNRYAGHNLGVMYLLGRGVPQDINTGMRLLNEGTKFRIPESSIVIGMFYEAKKDWGKAAFAYEGAKGYIEHPIAKTRLGILMVRGLGMQQNIKEGRLLIEEAAKMWWPESQWTLAQMAQLGIGGKPDMWQAAWWATILRANPLARGTQYEELAIRIGNGAGLNEQAWREITGSTKIWIEANNRFAKNFNYWNTASGPLM